jgi:hypothetical protein
MPEGYGRSLSAEGWAELAKAVENILVRIFEASNSAIPNEDTWQIKIGAWSEVLQEVPPHLIEECYQQHLRSRKASPFMPTAFDLRAAWSELRGVIEVEEARIQTQRLLDETRQGHFTHD